MPFNDEELWSVLVALLTYGICKSLLASVGAFIFNKFTGR